MSTAFAIVNAKRVLYNADKAGAGVTQANVPERALCRCYGTGLREKVFPNATADSCVFCHILTCILSSYSHLHIVLGDDAQEVDVVVGVKASHLLTADGLRSEDLHFAVQTIVDHQVMSHSHTVRFHGMPLPVVVIPDLSCTTQRGHRSNVKNMHAMIKDISSHNCCDSTAIAWTLSQLLSRRVSKTMSHAEMLLVV